MSLRGRFAAAASAIALVTLSGSLSAVWLAYVAGQQRQLDAALLREAEEESRKASYSGEAAGSGRPSLPRVATQPMTVYAAAYDADGPALSWTPNLDAAQPSVGDVRHAAKAPFDFWWNNEHLRAVLTPLPGDRGRELWIGTPRTDLDDDGRDLARKMAIAVLVAVAASAALAWWFARVLTRDHNRIAAVARAVAAGDLSARVGTSASDPEMARLGRDIDEMITRLAVLLETQERFIANASHELRSPVTTMLGELSFALHRDRDAATYRESIHEALASARRLKTLAEDLLVLTRAGSVEFEPEPVFLADVTRAALDASRAAADAAGVRLEDSCNGAVVEGHPNDLQRLVRNLVENAVRHSPPGGRVRVEAHPSQGDVHVVVSDEGPGIPSEVRERIFEPFFRCPAARADASGAGLGLAIARGIARAHGGDLWVEQAENVGGARFVVRIPMPGPAVQT
jgi:two-component system, OmpR family, sensor kinase